MSQFNSSKCLHSTKDNRLPHQRLQQQRRPLMDLPFLWLQWWGYHIWQQRWQECFHFSMPSVNQWLQWCGYIAWQTTYQQIWWGTQRLSEALQREYIIGYRQKQTGSDLYSQYLKAFICCYESHFSYQFIQPSVLLSTGALDGRACITLCVC